MIWHNGKPTDVIAASDRSFQYGDGCFTTMLTRHGNIQYWDYHVERMEACLAVLGITLPDWTQISHWLLQATLPEDKAGLKLHISRGHGGRGYSPANLTHPDVTISHFAYPAHYAAWQQQGIALGICQQRMGLNPMLAGHKHNNRLEQVVLKGEMDQAGYKDGVCLDLNHNVVETTMANLFWRKGQTLYTPNLTQAGVAGVARRVIVEQAPDLGLNLISGEFKLNHLADADEVFISNAIMEAAPVIELGGQSFPIGYYTRRFQESFHS